MVKQDDALILNKQAKSSGSEILVLDQMIEQNDVSQLRGTK